MLLPALKTMAVTSRISLEPNLRIARANARSDASGFADYPWLPAQGSSWGRWMDGQHDSYQTTGTYRAIIDLNGPFVGFGDLAA